MNSFELKINRAAQGLISKAQAIEWFRSLSAIEKKEVMRALGMCVHESHPIKDEVDPAISDSGLKATFTPCVLLKQATVPEKSIHKILLLPENEQEKSFVLLLSLFSIADKRRRETTCINGCNHEWHHLAP